MIPETMILKPVEAWALIGIVAELLALGPYSMYDLARTEAGWSLVRALLWLTAIYILLWPLLVVIECLWYWASSGS
jgi:hypothetical protein